MNKGKSKPLRGTIIYLLLVIVTGYILQTTGNFDDPFAEVASTIARETLGDNAQVIAGSTHGLTNDNDHSLRGINANGEKVGDHAAQGTGANSDEPGGDRIEPKAGEGALRARSDDHTEEESISWSRIGDIVFDVWFIGFITAVIIVVQQLSSVASSKLKKRSRPALMK